MDDRTPRPVVVSRRIEDHALIGDTHTAALVSRDGAITWLCLPRFDAPACFASLLGGDDDGHWTICPLDRVRSTTRSYRRGTLVLETLIETDTGAARVIDFMPHRHMAPTVVRIVEGVLRRRARELNPDPNPPRVRAWNRGPTRLSGRRRSSAFLAGGEIQLHRQRDDVDQLAVLGSEQVRANYVVGGPAGSARRRGPRDHARRLGRA